MTLPHLWAAERGQTSPILELSDAYVDQIYRRIEGHKDALKSRFYAIKDATLHRNDSKGKKRGYVYNAEQGYKYTGKN